MPKVDGTGSWKPACGWIYAEFIPAGHFPQSKHMIPCAIIVAQDCFLFWIFFFTSLFVPLIIKFSISSSEEYIQLILIPIYMFLPDLITYYMQMQTQMQQIADALNKGRSK